MLHILCALCPIIAPGFHGDYSICLANVSSCMGGSTPKPKGSQQISCNLSLSTPFCFLTTGYEYGSAQSLFRRGHTAEIGHFFPSLCFFLFVFFLSRPRPLFCYVLCSLLVKFSPSSVSVLFASGTPSMRPRRDAWGISGSEATSRSFKIN